MRLCIVNTTDFPPRFADTLLASYEPSFAKVLRADTEVVFKPAKGGLRGDNVTDFDNPYFASLNTKPIIEAFLEAERESSSSSYRV